MIVLECFLLNSWKAIKMERRSFLVRCRRTYILINYTKSLNKPGNKQTPFKMRKLFELYINCCLKKRRKQRKGQIAQEGATYPLMIKQGGEKTSGGCPP